MNLGRKNKNKMSEADHSEIIHKAMDLAKAGRFQDALEALQSMDEALSISAEAIYIQAVCLRKLNKNEQAVDALQRVLELDNNYVRAYQELGHIFVSEGRIQNAIGAYEQALSVDSALVASWRALTALFAKTKEADKLKIAQHQLAQLEQLHPALQAVKSHLNRGDLETADEICRGYLQQNKTDVEGMRLLAAIAVEVKILDDAEFILESAVSFDPSHIGAQYDYSNVLLKRQKFGAAHEIAQELVKQRPDEVQFKSLLASTTTGVGNTERGIELYRELINDENDMQQCYLLLGHAQKTQGDIEGAVQSYQKLFQHKPDFGDAFWSLANTKTYKFSDQEITHIQDYKDRETTSDINKVHFNFALGKALEDRKDYDASFMAYREGNSLNKALLKYQSSEIIKRVDAQIKRCDKALFDRLSGVGNSAADPIFILGLPRSGSTLLEQVLASHSQVDGTLELPNIMSLVHRLQGRAKVKIDEEAPYPKILTELEPGYFEKFGQQYIDDTRVFRKGAPFFIDKMPNNFLHVGLIKLILPNAKIIDARRHPMACCFSNFKQLFAEGQEFTYGLQEVGEYYRHYLRVMDHWDQVLPGFVLRVQHEEVVDDLETQVHRILDFCSLPFEQSCLEFYKTERHIRTPSSEQVRQPIYKTGLEQWRNFESHLEPLIDALGPQVLARYPIPE